MFGVSGTQRMRQRMLEQLAAGQGLQTRGLAQPAFTPTQAPAARPPQPQAQPGTMMAPSQTLFGQSALAPAPANDDTFVATASRITPDDSPLAMTQSAQAFQPKKPGFLDRLGFAGTALAEGPTAAREARTGWDARQRAQWQEQQTAASRTTSIDVVRRILATDNDPQVRAVAQMAPTPEAFIEFYANYQEKAADRALQTRGLDINEKGTDAQIRQGDRGLDQNDRRISIEHRQTDAGIDVNRRNAATNEFNAQTGRMQAESMGLGRDPVANGFLRKDIERIDEYDTARDALLGTLPEISQFLSLNREEQGTGNFSWATTGMFNDAETKGMKAISSRLFPIMSEALKGATSEGDRETLMQGLPSVNNSYEGNQKIARQYQLAAKRAADRSQFAREAVRDPKVRSLDTFNRLWTAYINEVSIARGDERDYPTWLREKQRAAGAQR